MAKNDKRPIEDDLLNDKSRDPVQAEDKPEQMNGLYSQRTGQSPLEILSGKQYDFGIETDPNASGAVNALDVVQRVINEKAIHNAQQILQKYKEGKANLERKIIENEQWYKLRHWECMRTHSGSPFKKGVGDMPKQVQPTSAWLFNCLSNKHADAMDNFPAPNVLPREEGDKAEAEKLSSIIPVILDQNEFEQTYSDVWHYKLHTGCGVYGVFWDKDKLNGVGDISIEKVDLLNLFWEPGITDIQKSRNLFHVELADNDALMAVYPQLTNKLGGSHMDIGKYIYDDTVDTTNKSVVVDWYYKKNVGSKTVLHYVKYVNDTVLFATEDDPAMKERGLYDHGMYPFVFDVLFPMEGTPAGFGYIDVGKDCQAYIDRASSAVMQNLLTNARPRYFVNSAGAVNEEEFADWTKDIVHVDGQLGQDSIAPIVGKGLDGIYVEVLNNKIEELKETTGNRDVSNGGTSAGVTSASGIAAQQEMASKGSRDMSKASYRAYRKMILLVIELIRQFYDLPRQFRIMGASGTQRFVNYSNEGLQPIPQPGLFGMDGGLRVPLFDVEITAQKQSPYSKMSQNDLALNFYQLGFFNPEMSDQALACLEMMDFDRKEFVMQKIEENGTMMQMIQQLQQQMMALGAIVDADRNSNEVTSGLAQQFGMAEQPMPQGAEKKVDTENNAVTGGEESPSGEKESWVTKKARQQAAERTSV